MISRSKLFSLLVIILGISSTALAAVGGGSSLTMEISPAYQGYFKYGEWLPVWVTLDNLGADLQAEVHVRVSGSTANSVYAVAVALPAGSHKILPLYVLPNNFSHELQAELVSAGEVLLSETITVRPKPNITFLTGIIARERGALSLLQAVQLPNGRTHFLVDLSILELPEHSAALNSFDCLILNDTDTSRLTTAQAEALLHWVQRGGRLVVGGGVGTQQTLAGLPEPLVPLTLLGVSDLETVSALADLVDNAPIRVPGSFAVASGDPAGSATLVEQDGHPLVLEKMVGNGWVDFIALDLSAAPFDAWSGTTAFWQALITPGADYQDFLPPDMSPRQMLSNAVNNALYNLPSLDLPSARWLTILLGIYIVLVGPVNYFILRSRKKLYLAWITIPSITLLFSGMSFGLGYAMRGTDLIINKIAIARAQPGSPAQVYSYIGLFSPANLTYEIEVEGDHLLSPMMMDYYDPWATNLPDTQEITYLQGNPGLVRGLAINQWSMQNFMTEGSWEIGDLLGELVLVDGKLTGELTNRSVYNFQDVVVVLRNNFVRLGDLPAGETTQVSMDLGNFEDSIFGGGVAWRIYESQYDPASGRSSRETDFKRMILEGVLDQNFMYGGNFIPGAVRSAKDQDDTQEVTVLGWIDEAPPQVLVNGNVPQETARTLYLAQIPYHFLNKGAIEVPVGMIPGVIAEMPVSGGMCGGVSPSLWFDRGQAVFEFLLPAELRQIELDTLLFFIKSDSGMQLSPQVELYDWKAASWQPLKNVETGINTLPDPQAWVNTDGLVRVRLSLDANFQGGGCYFAGLGLTGQR